MIPDWLATDAVIAAQSCAAFAYKPGKPELNLTDVVRWWEAVERVGVYEAAMRRPGEWAQFGCAWMKVDGQAPA